MKYFLVLILGLILSSKAQVEDGEAIEENPNADRNQFVPLNYGQLWGITQVKGYTETSKKGRKFYSFLSIPYAEPPVDKLRLKVKNLF